jgi:hypothetical protein
MISIPSPQEFRNVNRVLVGRTPYFRLHLKHHGSRFDLLLDTLEEALIIRDGIRQSGFYFQETWTIADLQWLRSRLKAARLRRRRLEQPDSFGPRAAIKPLY